MKIPYSLLLSFFFVQMGLSQGNDYPKNQDFESWTAGKLRMKLNKTWSIDLENQLRFKTNLTEYDRFFSQLNTQYKIDGFEYGGGFRYLQLNDNVGNKQGAENHFRFHLDFGYELDADRCLYKVRIRLQHRNELGLSKHEGDYPSKDLRVKASFKYNFRNWKFDPRMSWEVFRHYQTGALNGFNKYRLTFGTSYKINKEQRLALSYVQEKQLVYWNPKVTRILLVSYLYTIKMSKKDK
ncbi:MAG TPA: DUF2490 domain-containing protein [Flavobacteriales bacterium]|nr:DUF2490 domain-containing protein [Flavobacteriales bacterium]